MRFKSRFTVIGILALLAIMVITIMPASAGSITSGTVTVTVQRNIGTPLTAAESTRVGNVLWVSNDDDAFNRVTIVLVPTGGSGLGNQTAVVENSTLGGTDLNVTLVETPATGTLTIVSQPVGEAAATGTITLSGDFNLLAGDIVTVDGTALTEGNQWARGADLTAAATSLAAAIDALTNVGASSSLGVVTVTATAVGTGGNSIAMLEDDTDGVIALSGSTLSGGVNADTMIIFGKTYTFQANGALTDSDGNIEVGTDLAGTQTNIVNALSLAGTAGTGYALSMTSGAVSAATFGADGVTNEAPLTHKAGGTSPGNDASTLADTFADSNNTFSGTALTGGLDNGDYLGHFFVGTTTAAATGLNTGIIGALNLNILRVVSGDVVSLTVDAKAPSISGLLPEHDEVTRAKTIDFRATIADAGSGIIPDEGDIDNDSVTKEPLSDATTGETDNISIKVSTVENSDRALWTEITAGQAYSFTFAKALAEATHNWQIIATDRVGNTETTDSDDESGDQPNDFIIDATAAVMGVVTTGIEWDATDKEESRDDASIKIVFTKTGTTTVPDNMDSSTLQASDFQVEDNTVTGLTFPNLPKKAGVEQGKDINGALFSTRNIVYLALGDDVAADGTPKVSLVGTVTDKAGNVSAIGEEDAIDGIQPDFTVTITGLTSSRPITDDDDDNEIVVRIVSNEQLNAAPTVRFNTLKWDDVTSNRLEVDDSISKTPKVVSGLTNTWETKQTQADVAGGTDGLISVHVEGTDLKANTGTDGSGRDPGDKVDLKKANLFEFDSDLADPVFTLTPSSGTDKTESSSPFIVIDFDAEGKEYQIFTGGGTDPATTTPVDKLSFGSPPVSVEIDSHDAVTLTKLELEDEDGNKTDLLGSQGTVDENSFVVSLPDLAVGTYTLTVNGTDDVGNKLSSDNEFPFEVEERSEYEVTLEPGWNLISLPGTPADPSIDSVLPDSMKVSRVLQWVGGAFQVAERGDDGMWDPSGQITEITAGPGYWVFTTAFEDIETLIPERNPATVLPTVDIVGGWNLVGVVDQAQEDQGKPPGDVETFPAVYFSSIEWSVAYSYDTTTATWTKYIETTEIDVVNGKGYWVWAKKAGTLVP